MKKSIISFVTVSVLLIITIVYSAITGSIKVGAWDFVTNLFSSSNEQVEIVKDLRLPRIIVSLFSGAALALSGALLQSVLRNPLADAGVIGVSSGASFFFTLTGNAAAAILFLDTFICVHRRYCFLFSYLLTLLEIWFASYSYPAYRDCDQCHVRRFDAGVYYRLQLSRQNTGSIYFI